MDNASEIHTLSYFLSLAMILHSCEPKTVAMQKGNPKQFQYSFFALCALKQCTPAKCNAFHAENTVER